MNELEVESAAGAAVVKLRGTTDSSSVGALTAAFDRLLADGISLLVVDLTEAVLIDSTVLGALVYTQKRLRSAGGDLAVAGANREIRHVFRITGLDRSFDLVGNVDEALHASGPSPLRPAS